jgi:hypothetical protein
MEQVTKRNKNIVCCEGSSEQCPDHCRHKKNHYALLDTCDGRPIFDLKFCDEEGSYCSVALQAVKCVKGS